MSRASRLPFWEIGKSEPCEFESEPRVRTLDESNQFKIDTCCFLAWRSALLLILGEGKGWLAQCQNNVTEWDSRCWLGVLVRQHYEVAMSTHSQKSVPFLA